MQDVFLIYLEKCALYFKIIKGKAMFAEKNISCVCEFLCLSCQRLYKKNFSLNVYAHKSYLFDIAFRFDFCAYTSERLRFNTVML